MLWAAEAAKVAPVGAANEFRCWWWDLLEMFCCFLSNDEWRAFDDKSFASDEVEFVWLLCVRSLIIVWQSSRRLVDANLIFRLLLELCNFVSWLVAVDSLSTAACCCWLRSIVAELCNSLALSSEVKTTAAPVVEPLTFDTKSLFCELSLQVCLSLCAILDDDEIDDALGVGKEFDDFEVLLMLFLVVVVVGSFFCCWKVCELCATLAVTDERGVWPQCEHKTFTCWPLGVFWLLLLFEFTIADATLESGGLNVDSIIYSSCLLKIREGVASVCVWGSECWAETEVEVEVDNNQRGKKRGERKKEREREEKVKNEYENWELSLSLNLNWKVLVSFGVQYIER